MLHEGFHALRSEVSTIGKQARAMVGSDAITGTGTLLPAAGAVGCSEYEQTEHFTNIQSRRTRAIAIVHYEICYGKCITQYKYIFLPISRLNKLSIDVAQY